MAIIVHTRYPDELRNQIRSGIDSQEINTWQYDADGDFTSMTVLWKNRAWFRPYIEPDNLVFAILGRKDSLLTVTEYAYYHSRFAEMLMAHFSNDITEIIVQTPFTNSKDTQKIERL